MLQEKAPEISSKKLSENLSALLEHRNLSIAKFSEALDLPVMTVRRLLYGETINPRLSTLKLLADYFKISVDALIGDDSELLVKFSKRTKPYFIPILNWETAEKIKTIHELDMRRWEEWQSVSLNRVSVLGKSSFALKSRPALYSRFPQGTLFVIDPDASPEDGDIVLVKMIASQKITLRELVIDSPEWHLHPLVPESSSLLYSEKQHKIVGVNLLTLLYNRKLS